MKGIKRFVTLVCLVLVCLSLVLAGCSSPAPATPAPAANTTSAAAAPTKAAAGTTSAAASTTSAAAAAPKTLSKVKVSHATVGVFRLPLYVALQNGYFKEEGLDIEIIDSKSGSDAMKLLAGGGVEFATGQLLDAVNLQREGIDVKGIAILTNRMTNSLTVKKGLEGQIKSMADLKGKTRTIGITSVGSGTWQFAVYLASLEKISKDDLNLVAVGAGAAAIQAMKAGKIDAMSMADPENYQVVADGDASFLYDTADVAQHKKYIGDTYLNNQVMTRGDYIKSNPQNVQAFVNGIQRAIGWINQHTPEETAKLILGYQGWQGTSEKVLVDMLKRGSAGNPKSAVIEKDAFDNGIKLPLAVGAIDKSMPYEQVINTDFAKKAAEKYPVK
jgi:NitT/TauT family transport system substrate-binding protein